MGSTNYVKLDDSIRLSGSEDWQDVWTPPADLDAFLLRVYDYYRGKGFGCAVLSKLFNLLYVFTAQPSLAPFPSFISPGVVNGQN